MEYFFQSTGNMWGNGSIHLFFNGCLNMNLTLRRNILN